MDIINKFLCQAIQGESEAEKRYLVYCEKAIEEGFKKVAVLFTGLSHGESIHIANHRKALEKNHYKGPIPSCQIIIKPEATLDNLKLAIDNEKAEFSSMYPSFYRQIHKKHGQNFIAKIALLSIKWATESEKNHHLLLKTAFKAVTSGKDLDGGNIYLCAVCGNLHYSQLAPEEPCAVCGHDISFYTKVETIHDSI